MIIFAPNFFQLPLLSDTQNDDSTNEQMKMHLTSCKCHQMITKLHLI